MILAFVLDKDFLWFHQTSLNKKKNSLNFEWKIANDTSTLKMVQMKNFNDFNKN
jgi:hypothetical protein